MLVELMVVAEEGFHYVGDEMQDDENEIEDVDLVEVDEATMNEGGKACLGVVIHVDRYVEFLYVFVNQPSAKNAY